jgi:hypothetical protein
LLVGAVAGGFEPAVRLMAGVWLVAEATVGEEAAEAFVKEEKEQRDLASLWRETIGIAGSVALKEAVLFELTQVVAELVEAVGVPARPKMARRKWWVCLAVQPSI